MMSNKRTDDIVNFDTVLWDEGSTGPVTKSLYVTRVSVVDKTMTVDDHEATKNCLWDAQRGFWTNQ